MPSPSAHWRELLLNPTTQSDDNHAMNAVVPSVSDDVWRSVRTPAPLRPGALAAGRARIVSGELPSALALADAVLAHVPLGRGRGVRWTA
jgi:hypothetical protein